MKLKLLSFLLVIVISHKATAQITYIPDQGFEWQLIHLDIDSDGIINGQVLTSDVENVTELIIEEGGIIYNLTGIQGFTSLEKLVINFSYITELDVSQNLQLTHLDCSSNELTSLDVSSNTLLEILRAGSIGGDVGPFNMIEEIDLSNNPNIHTLDLQDSYSWIKRINLKNGNNNPNMTIDVGNYPWSFDDPDYNVNDIYYSVCIEVDDSDLALNNNYPYSEWNIYHQHTAYIFTDDVIECSLNTPIFTQSNIKVYPNPVSDVLYFDTKSNNFIQKATIFDFLGRKVTEQTNGTDAISVSHLQKGSYLIKIVTDKGVQTEKIIVK